MVDLRTDGSSAWKPASTLADDRRHQTVAPDRVGANDSPTSAEVDAQRESSA
jgi:hypothetical protein